MRIIITEEQFKTIVVEYYERDRLYHKESVFKELEKKKAPKYVKELMVGLKDYNCTDEWGNRHICIKLPEAVYRYFYDSNY